MRIEISIELDEGQTVEQASAGLMEMASNFGEANLLDVDYEGEIPQG